MSTLKEKALQIQAEKNEKIIPENFSEELSIFGVSGNVRNFCEESIELNNISMDDYGSSVNIIGGIENIGSKGLIDGMTSFWANLNCFRLADTIGLTADKIKKNETILGITGTYDGGSSAKDSSLIPVSLVAPELLVINSWDSEIYNGLYWDCGTNYEDEIIVMDKDNKAIRKNIPLYIFLDTFEGGGEYSPGQFNISYRFYNSEVVQNQLIEYFGTTLELNKIYTGTLRACSPYSNSCVQQEISIKFVQAEE